jgi:hypothetical protein
MKEHTWKLIDEEDEDDPEAMKICEICETERIFTEGIFFFKRKGRTEWKSGIFECKSPSDFTVKPEYGWPKIKFLLGEIVDELDEMFPAK